MVERDTWENRENLENAGDLLKEFKEEYSRSDKEVRWQEETEDDREYWRGVMETLDSTELLMEDQAWLDYLWDFETREINLDLSSDTD